METFGYTKRDSNVIAPVTQVNLRSKTASALNGLLDLANTGMKVYQQKQQQDNDAEILNAGNLYRQEKDLYISGLSEVKGDAKAYQKHLDGFNKRVEEISLTLSDEKSRNTFLNNAGNFTMYQGFALEEQQRLETRLASEASLTEQTILSAEVAGQESIDAVNNQLAITMKNGTRQDVALTNVAQGLFTSWSQQLNDNPSYAEIKAMRAEYDRWGSGVDKLNSNSQYKQIGTMISKFENSFKSQTLSRLQDYMKLGQVDNFQEQLEIGLQQGAIEQEDKQIWVDLFNQKQADPSNMFFNQADSELKNGNFWNLNSIPSEFKSSYKKQLQPYYTSAIAEMKDMNLLTKLKATNFDMYQDTVDEVGNNYLNNLSMIVSNPKATKEDIDNALGSAVNFLNVHNQQNSLSKDMKSKLSQLNVIMKSASIPDKQKALTLINNPSYTQVPTNSKLLKEATEGIRDINDKEEARQLLSYLKNINGDEQEIVDAIQTQYRPIEMGTNFFMTPNTLSKFGLFGDEGELFINSYRSFLEEDDRAKFDSDYKKLEKFGGEIEFRYENGWAIFETGSYVNKYQLSGNKAIELYKFIQGNRKSSQSSWWNTVGFGDYEDIKETKQKGFIKKINKESTSEKGIKGYEKRLNSR